MNLIPILYEILIEPKLLFFIHANIFSTKSTIKMAAAA